MIEPDYDDDWMNPKPVLNWTPREVVYPRYVIERERRIQGPITTWDDYEDFATRQERDARLRQLRTDHPAWHLRPRDDAFKPHWIAIA